MMCHMRVSSDVIDGVLCMFVDSGPTKLSLNAN